MTLNYTDAASPNTMPKGKLRLHQHSGPSRRHMRRKLEALKRKLAKFVAKQEQGK